MSKTALSQAINQATQRFQSNGGLVLICPPKPAEGHNIPIKKD